MSLLSELEELQRCLEGSADSDSEEQKKAVEGESLDKNESSNAATVSEEGSDSNNVPDVSECEYTSLAEFIMNEAAVNSKQEDGKASGDVSEAVEDKESTESAVEVERIKTEKSETDSSSQTPDKKYSSSKNGSVKAAVLEDTVPHSPKQNAKKRLESENLGNKTEKLSKIAGKKSTLLRSVKKPFAEGFEGERQLVKNLGVRSKKRSQSDSGSVNSTPKKRERDYLSDSVIGDLATDTSEENSPQPTHKKKNSTESMVKLKKKKAIFNVIMVKDNVSGMDLDEGPQMPNDIRPFIRQRKLPVHPVSTEMTRQVQHAPHSPGERKRKMDGQVRDKPCPKSKKRLHALNEEEIRASLSEEEIYRPSSSQQNFTTISEGPIKLNIPPLVNGESRKELMETRVVLKKLNIPMPDHLTNKPLKLQETLARVSQDLQETLTLPRKKSRGRPKVTDSGKGGKQTNKKPNQKGKTTSKAAQIPKTIGKPIQKKKVMAKQIQKQKIIGKSMVNKKINKERKGKPEVVRRPTSTQKVAANVKQTQKLTIKQSKKKISPKIVEGREAIRLAEAILRQSVTRRTIIPNIVSRIGPKRKRTLSKRLLAFKLTDIPGSRTRVVSPSATAKKSSRQVSSPTIGKSAPAASVVKKVVGNKKVPASSSVGLRSTAKPRTVPSAVNQQKLRAGDIAGNRVKKVDLPTTKRTVLSPPAAEKVKLKPTRPPASVGDSADEDEWIVEVLLDDDVNMMMSNPVSSSDDKLRSLLGSVGDALECDSSTDSDKQKLGAKGFATRNNALCCGHAAGPKSFPFRRTVTETVPSSHTKQVSSSVLEDKAAESARKLSMEQKMAEMKKAISDLERVADRSMLRLKAEERQVIYLLNKLNTYENNKYHRNLQLILKDAAAGPKQSDHAVFLLDLISSYCPLEEEGEEEVTSKDENKLSQEDTPA